MAPMKVQHRKGAPLHGAAHHRRGVGARFARLRAAGAGGFVAFLAVLGPGLLAGLSDDDPAGITTYSVLGASHGYTLLWIIPASTILLVQFHLMAVRIGAASGKGFVGVIRDRWGHGWGYAAALGLLFANFGTICAEYAGISAAGSLVGIPSWVSTPIAAVLISLVVVLGSFHRVERVLLVISATLALYIVDGILAGPDWQQVWHHSLVPHLPTSPLGWIAIAAALGTTLAPWGLAFIQSYAVDKKITVASLHWERVDVVIGSLLTGIIGLAIAVACAATLNRAGIAIQEASLVDIKEEADRFVLLADIPGVDPQDIDVQMDKGLLTIKGERTLEARSENERFSRTERVHGVFHRRFALPDSADPERITASGRNGVLQIVIPKKPETTPRKIQVGTVHDA